MITIANPSDKFFTQVDARDVYKFLSQLTEELTMNPIAEEMKVFVGNSISKQDPKNDNMITIEIKFQIFNRESQKEWRGVWTTYRAKSHACSQSGFNNSIAEVEKKFS